MVAICIALSQYILAFAAARVQREAQNENTVTGIVVIRDQTYRATCNCPANVNSLENMVYLSRGLCYPSKIKVRTHGKHDDDEYKLLLNSMQFIPHEDFKNVENMPLSAMDGRVEGKSFYAPGGDLGIFTIAMINMYEGDGIPTQTTVTNTLRQFVRQMPEGRQFRHATDENAIENIRKALNWEVVDLTNIDTQYQSKVKDVTAAGALGDPFFAFMLHKFHSDPVKKKIIVACVHAFLEILWDKTDLLWEQIVLQLLKGEPKPRALVEVSVAKGCEIARMAPQVITNITDNQFLIYTEFATNYRKKEIAAFLYNRQDPKKHTMPLDEVIQHLDKLTHALTEEFGT
ncbi:uncharacterized protein BXIN_0066 [Babesia sp. Xinjiang]|uniref:uncharacterized protein n=1 Tax=Babesia sp. Xinjiang TaxID=462227 RepID=UPI000A22E25A|nr:uncharacterized protein BXIN_0066 [Babesia sp. Xinjiang]ORM39668.1 hypothetical protein BXIN_0066 [Babesia sp. Xinjiang]